MADTPLTPPAAPALPTAAPDTIDLINRKGERQAFAPKEVGKALASGEWGAHAGTPIPVWANGNITTVPVENVLPVLAKGGVVVSHAQRQAALDEEQFGNLTDQLEAAAGSAVGSVPIIGPGALAMLPAKTKANLLKKQEVNPFAKGVGTIGGIGAQALAAALTGGGSAALEGAAGAGEGAEALNAVRAARAATGLAGAEELGAGAEAAALGEGTAVPALPPRGVPELPPGLPVPGAPPELPPGPLPQFQGTIRNLGSDVRAAEGAVEAVADAGVPGTASPMVEAAAGQGANAEQAGQAATPGVLNRLGQVVAAPQEAISHIGGMAERGIQALLPDEAKGLAARLASKSLGLAARGAAEGSIYGTNDYLNEQALSANPELDGQKLLAAFGHGALLGAGAGGLLGAGATLGADLLGRVGTKLEGVSGDLAANSILTTPAGSKLAKRMEELPEGGKRGVGKLLVDDGLLSKTGNIEETFENIKSARQATGEHLGALRDSATATGAEGPKAASVYRSVDRVLEGMEKEPVFQKGAINTVTEYRDYLQKVLGLDEATIARETAHIPGIDADAIKAAGGNYQRALKDAAKKRAAIIEEHVENKQVSFSDLAKLRAKLDKEIDFNRRANNGAPNHLDEALKKIRGSMEDAIEEAGEKVKLPDEMGKEWLQQYKDAKIKYRQLSVAEEAAEKTFLSRSKNRKLSLSDMLTGGALAAGHIAFGGPAGALTGLAGALAHKAVRERGAAVAAQAIDKLSALGSVQAAVARVDRQVARGVSAALRHDSNVTLKGPPPHGLDTFEEKKEALEATAANMPGHLAAINAAAAPFTAHAPQTASAMTSAAIRSTQYLLSILPQATPINPLQPKAGMVEPSDYKKHEFNEAFEAVHNPPGVLASVAKGTVTPAAVKALATALPAVKQNMDFELRKAMAESVEPLSAEQIVPVSIFLGIPASTAMQAGSVAGFQAVFASTPKGAEHPGGTPPAGPQKEKHAGVKSAMRNLSVAQDTSLETRVT